MYLSLIKFIVKDIKSASSPEYARGKVGKCNANMLSFSCLVASF